MSVVTPAASDAYLVHQRIEHLVAAHGGNVETEYVHHAGFKKNATLVSTPRQDIVLVVLDQNNCADGTKRPCVHMYVERGTNPDPNFGGTMAETLALIQLRRWLNEYA